MADLSALFAPDALALLDDARARVDAAWAASAYTDGDCAIVEAATLLDPYGRVTVWHTEGDRARGREITIAADEVPHVVEFERVLGADGAVRAETESIDGQAQKVHTWSGEPGDARYRHTTVEPWLDARSRHDERVTDDAIIARHKYREGPFHKNTFVTASLDHQRRIAQIEVKIAEGPQTFHCATSYAWTTGEAGDTATFDQTCDGEHVARGTEARDDTGRLVSRTLTYGTTQADAWGPVHAWTWDARGLTTYDRVEPMVGEVHTTYVRDEQGRITRVVDQYRDAAFVALYGPGCDAPEPWVARWSGDEERP